MFVVVELVAFYTCGQLVCPFPCGKIVMTYPSAHIYAVILRTNTLDQIRHSVVSLGEDVVREKGGHTYAWCQIVVAGAEKCFDRTLILQKEYSDKTMAFTNMTYVNRRNTRIRIPFFAFGLALLYSLLHLHGLLVWAADRRSDIVNGGLDLRLRYNATLKKFDLGPGFTWKSGGDFGVNDYMTLHKNEEFDGHDIEIGLGGVGVEGLIAIEESVTSIEEAPFIHNLHIRGGHIWQADEGFIIRNNARFYHVDSCTVTGQLQGSGTGGIAGGMNAHDGGEIIISNCTSEGTEIGAEGTGGIIGRNAGENGGKVSIIDCHSTRNIAGRDTGGIVGTNAGIDGGEVFISNCSSVGMMKSSGTNQGGICGANAGNRGQVCIENSFFRGDITSEFSGGICGNFAGNNGVVSILNCFSEGAIPSSAGNSGGICGSGAGEGGQIYIQNSHFRGEIRADAAGGICGKYAGTNGGNASIIGCSSEGTIFSSAASAGGICGEKAGYGGQLHIENSHFRGDIDAKNAGGICGYYAGGELGKVFISGSSSEATILDAATGSGGICGGKGGYGGEIYIEKSFFRGKIESADTGGICGESVGANGGKVSIVNCFSEADIDSHATRAGGICGSKAGDGGTVFMEKSFFVGDIGSAHSGGIFGQLAGSNGGKINVSMCYFAGNIEGQDSGGIFGDKAGNNNGEVFVWNSYSRGTVNGHHAGGMFGGDSNNAAKVEIYDSYASGKVADHNGGSIFGHRGGKEDQTRVDHTVYNERICSNTNSENCSPWKNETSDNLVDITGKLYCGPKGRCWNSDVWMMADNETFPVLRRLSSPNSVASPTTSPFPQANSVSPSVTATFSDSASPFPMLTYSMAPTPTGTVHPSSSTRTPTKSATSSTSPTATHFGSNSPSTGRSFIQNLSPTMSPSGLPSTNVAPSGTTETATGSVDGTVYSSQSLVSPSPSPTSSTSPNSDQTTATSQSSLPGTVSPSPTRQLKSRMELPCQHPARAVIVSDD